MIDAREQLNAALAIFERLGARPWVDRATAELRATGQTKPRAGDNVLDRLTPQEFEIVTLAASGMTNKADRGAAVPVASDRRRSPPPGLSQARRVDPRGPSRRARVPAPGAAPPHLAVRTGACQSDGRRALVRGLWLTASRVIGRRRFGSYDRRASRDAGRSIYYPGAPPHHCDPPGPRQTPSWHSCGPSRKRNEPNEPETTGPRPRVRAPFVPSTRRTDRHEDRRHRRHRADRLEGRRGAHRARARGRAGLPSARHQHDHRRRARRGSRRRIGRRRRVELAQLRVRDRARLLRDLDPPPADRGGGRGSRASRRVVGRRNEGAVRGR